MSPNSERSAFGRWTPELSIRMRSEGDFEADKCVAELEAHHQMGPVQSVFRSMPRNDSRLPDDAPAPLKHFFQHNVGLPIWADPERIRRGEEVFLENGLPIAVVLLCRSIPEGYGAPTLTEILYMTGVLADRPYHRLLAVLQMVLDVAVDGGFEPEGKALRVAMKLRLLHAGIRRMAVTHLKDYEKEHDIPCNHEDMLATLLAFSLLVIEGLQSLGAPLSPSDAEDLFYPWRVFAVCMGIPEEYVPRDVADARQCYAAYASRQYVPAAQNQRGVLLAQANTQMLKDLIPGWAHRLGAGVLPEIFMWQLMGKDACERVQIPPVHGHWALKKAALLAVQATANPDDSRFKVVLSPASRWVTQAVYGTLIRREYNGVPKIIIPQKIADVWKI